MSNIIIWDSQILPNKSTETTILWQQFCQINSDNQISLPELIEKNANKLKSRYLTWVYDLSESKLDSLNVVSALEIRQNFSYWWMTPLAEKLSFSKPTQITDAIRLMAFDDWNNSAQARSIKLVSNNPRLVKALNIYCKGRSINFEWCKSHDRVDRQSLRSRLSRNLPGKVKVFIWLLQYTLYTHPSRKLDVSAWKNSKAKITFFSYFEPSIDTSKLNHKFESSYWGSLPNILQAADKPTNWLHILADKSKLSSSDSATRLIKQIYNSNKTNQNHILLDSFFDSTILVKTIKDYLYLQKQLRKFEKVLSQTQSENLQIWPFFKDQYQSDSRGVRTVENILNLNLLERACALLPRQDTGVYLFEQQPWEFALINSWRSHNHGTLIGAQHTTVLFWDLRYFNDSRSYSNRSLSRIPTPDQIGVNGPISMITFLHAGYPKNILISTEALRYEYIEKCLKSMKNRQISKDLRILVLGDYSIEDTNRQIRILEKAIGLLNFNPVVIMRPHPYSQFNDRDFNFLKVTKRTLPELLVNVDMVYTSASTSAAVDAYCMGLPVVSTLDPKKLNLSPLRGIPGVIFVDTPHKLARFIQHQYQGVAEPGERIEFFNLDSKLRGWMGLFEI